ncbi:S1C family serine protease [Alkalibacillus haloalkaliphilus]|uniref:S1C family serine protease n=1 Tax=Alkalibacillus haloalkaliphilus TaxID=94136 RepID=UPI0029353632|nr:serine protease [Alkalibacillus haloalkaliphilus]MDV2582481.1 serine protease [Alkalibacillus haloalkaliphilus]
MTDEYKRPETEDEVDLYEDLEEEEIKELLNEEKERINQKRKEERTEPKRPFPKWMFWLIAIFLFFNIAATLPAMYPIPAIDFLRTSAQLMMDEEVQSYRESVVTVDTGIGRGTGFVISEDGYVITNEHVISELERLWIYFDGDGPYGATIEEAVPEIDLALLKVDGEGFPELDLAETASYQPNEPFYFIGSPLGFSGIANEGTIIGESSVGNIEGDVLVLDAPIYSGNSGSPVINQSGEVIAIIYATRTEDEHGRVGLAVPVDLFYEHLNE